ncbi:MAG: glycoside hydrolase family 36 protein [Bacteroidota bacterium]
MQYIKTCISYRVLGSNSSVNIEFEEQYQDEHIAIELLRSNNTTKLKIDATRPIELELLTHQYQYRFESSDQIMCNGFQSWTETRLFYIDEKIKTFNPLLARFSKPFGDSNYVEYPEKKGYLHAWSYAYIYRKNKTTTLMASLTDEDAFTLFEFKVPLNKIIISKDIKGCIIEKTAVLFQLYLEEGEEKSVFENYFAHSGFSYKPRKMNGWTSWYHYYTKINEQNIQSNIHNYTQTNNYPIDIFQIDDGWQKDIGTWMECNTKFPEGLHKYVTQLHAKKILAGLWLAPFICEKKSSIYKEHPEWILRDNSGNMVLAGYNPMWSGSFYVLDFYNDECRAYLKKVFQTILQDWQFDMLKLDFLYAVCLQSRAGKTRGTIMYEAMQWIREICGDKLILACGVPLMPCAGKVDFCRIGPDISLGWNDFFADFFGWREGISTRKSIQNTIARRHLDGYWFANDPDVFMLREEKQKMTWEQRNILFETNKTYGSLLFTSDNIETYDEEKKRLYRSLFRK